MKEEKSERSIDIEEIKEYLPHRYPFLVIDKIIDYREGEFLEAKKNVTINEEIFNGHFPSKPIYPGVLIIEGMAQASAMLCYLTLGIKDSGRPVYFLGLDSCRFRATVVPGDTINFKIKPNNIRKKVAKVEAKAFVGENLVAEATLIAMIGDKE